MILPSTSSERPLYSIPGRINTGNYSTGFYPFQTQQPLTFVMEATARTSNWNGAQSFCGLGSKNGDKVFRIGQGWTGTAYGDGNKSRKIALFANGAGKYLGPHVSESTLFRIAVTYDPDTLDLDGWLAPNYGEIQHTHIDLTSQIQSEDVLRLNSGATTTTIPFTVFAIYGRLWEEEEITDFVSVALPEG